jgi:hypothetical protein
MDRLEQHDGSHGNCGQPCCRQVHPGLRTVVQSLAEPRKAATAASCVCLALIGGVMHYLLPEVRLIGSIAGGYLLGAVAIWLLLGRRTDRTAV